MNIRILPKTMTSGIPLMLCLGTRIYFEILMFMWPFGPLFRAGVGVRKLEARGAFRLEVGLYLPAPSSRKYRSYAYG